MADHNANSGGRPLTEADLVLREKAELETAAAVNGL
jgi:hypothetical protein